jgi:EAL domain-containing protein (putative c-di-GMP-specific phosphodiesterase class I)
MDMTLSNILVVEDDALVRRAYERVLVGHHRVTAVSSAIEALEALGRSAFDAVVSDIDIPGLNGIELLKTMRETLSNIPVVFVTGCPSIRTAQDAVNFGAVGYLTKPVSAADLRSAVARATSGARITPVPVASGVDSLAARFEHALEELYMVFQPIVSMKQGVAMGYEALLRTKEKSLASPPDLLAAAESLDQVHRLGQLVRRKVAEAIPLAPKEARIFVNLHPRDLGDDELFSEESPLAAFADRVVLEITERASLDGVDDAHARVMALRKLGYWLAIDDLGAGYAGLTSVTRLEPEVVKIDMTLVRGIDKSRAQQHFVASLARVCGELGMIVVTEGVETDAERDTLLSLGCDVLQGYRFGRPTPSFESPSL